MLNIDTCELENEIVADLTIELSTDEEFNPKILERKVKNAVREVRMKRNYVASALTADEIKEDLYNYYSTIRNLALYDYNQVGIEFTTNTSENYSKTFMNRDDLFKGVHAFVGFIG